MVHFINPKFVLYIEATSFYNSMLNNISSTNHYLPVTKYNYLLHQSKLL